MAGNTLLPLFQTLSPGMQLVIGLMLIMTFISWIRLFIESGTSIVYTGRWIYLHPWSVLFLLVPIAWQLQIIS